jgi:hypothetical protein
VRLTIPALIIPILCACSPPALPPIPPGDCPQDAKLPFPPSAKNRSVPIIVAWANTAAGVANKAIAERTICAGSYDRLRAWADGVVKARQ